MWSQRRRHNRSVQKRRARHPDVVSDESMETPSERRLPTPEAPMPDTPDHVWVFGGDHSPWVQSVLLGLHEKKIAHTVTTVPPLSVFAKSGILMPAAQSDAGPWQLDSARILEQFGFRQVDEADQRALQRIFGAGALQRTVNPWDFWHKWSELRDGHASLGRRLFNHLLRPSSSLSGSAERTSVRRNSSA